MRTHPEKEKPTLSGPNFVGMALTSRWIAEPLLTFLAVFLATDLNVEGVPLRGNLSKWINRLQKKGLGTVFGTLSPWKGLTNLSLSLEFLRQLRNPPRAKEVTHQIQRHVSAEELDEIEALSEKRNFREFDERCQEIWTRAGLKSRLDILELVCMVRAAQAGLRCFALHSTNPLTLIERARRGERQAILDLVKVDNLFLTDECTQDVIQKAIWENDQRFIEQLARAEEYRAEFKQRHAYKLYVWYLQTLGIKFPPLQKLHEVIDPDGSVFTGFYAFERFVQRCRKEIQLP